MGFIGEAGKGKGYQWIPDQGSALWLDEKGDA